MKNRLYILLAVVFINVLTSLFLFSPAKVSASGTSLAVTPSTLQIQAKPPADIWAPFTIENQSNHSVILQIGYKSLDPQKSQNGTVVFLSNNQSTTGIDKNIFEKMQVVDENNISHDSIALGPEQKKRLRLRVRIPQKEPPSDYYFSLLFITKPININQNNSNISIENQKSFSTIQTGIGLNVFLAIGNKELPQGTISSFTTPFFQQAGPVPFSLTVNNNGTHYFTLHGTITIKNIFGQTVGKINLPSRIVLAGTIRTIGSTFDTHTANTLTSGLDNASQTSSPQIFWPEHFILGWYTATLSLSPSQHGPFFNRSIHFIAIPLLAVGEIFCLLLIIFLIYRRLKRKLS